MHTTVTLTKPQHLQSGSQLHGSLVDSEKHTQCIPKDGTGSMGVGVSIRVPKVEVQGGLSE